MDVHTKTIRSKNMAAIRSKNNKSTEQKLAAILRSRKIRGWRRHLPMPGKPDFVWPKYKIALFVDGCFWHACKKCFKAPKSNAEYWDKKIANNIRRDRKVTALLKKAGWKVFRIKECNLKNESRIFVINRIIKILGEQK